MASPSAHREFQLVCAVVRGRCEAARALAADPDFDWSGFIAYVDAQTLGSCVYHLAQGHSLIAIFPAPVFESLRRSFLTQVRWNSLLLARVADIERAVRERGREVIFLKGLHLANEYFGQLAARQVGDIDLLIADRHAVRQFEDILGGLGYRRRSRILASRALMTRYTHHMEFDGPLAPLDLHWVFRRHPSVRLDYSEIWHCKREVQIRNLNLSVLSPEYELVLQFLSMHNDLQLGVIRLKAFVDLYAMLKRIATTLDWEAFLARRGEEGLLRMSVNVLDLAFEILDCRSEFPAAAESIVRHRSLLVLDDIDAKLALFRGTIGEMRRRAWALRLYDTTPLRAFYWWGLSLPFRLAEHR